MHASDAKTGDLVITRVFDAPRDLVFKAWTDPAHLARWWGPERFTNPRCELDLRPGGAIRIDMRSPDGTVYPMAGTFEEIVAPERLVFRSAALNEKGEALFEVLTTVTFAQEADKTKLTMRAHVTKTTAEAEQHLLGMEAGWTQSLQRLENYVAGKKLTLTLPSDREILMTRIFDAPRELVFEAFTNPEMIAQWWGLRETTTVVEKMEVRPGGIWRYVQLDPDGSEHAAFNGVYREVVPPERLVSTFEYERMPGHVVLNTTTFEEIDGKTKITVRSLLQTREDRDGMLHSGMEKGANQAYDQLAELLARHRSSRA
jgi:uncharacterized protein YndB with AHSA1/START domain